MPQVPYNPVPSVGPSGQALPQQNIRAVGDAFGTGIAEATGKFGRQLEASGDELFKEALRLQTINNDAEAKEADAQYVMRSADLHANFHSLQGKAAMDARPKYIKDLEALRAEVRGTLSNPAAQKLFDGSTRQNFARSVFSAASHSATQLRQYSAGANKAEREAATMDAGVEPEDDISAERNLQRVRSTIQFQAKDEGWSPEQTAQSMRVAESGVLASRITGLHKREPFRADELLEKYRSRLTPIDLERVQNQVDTQVRNQGAAQIATRKNADLLETPSDKMPEKGLDERVKEAVEEAKRLRPDDTVFHQQVASQVRTGYTNKKRDIADTNYYNRQNVNTAIIGGYGDKLPSTVQELTAISPAIAESWNSLRPEQKSGFIKQLEKNAKGDVPETGERFTEYLKWRGMANSENDEERLKFIEKNVADLDLPRNRKLELIKKQESLFKGAGADPLVTKAYRQLVDLGIAPTVSQTNGDTVNLFRGLLQEALAIHQEKDQKAPDLDKIKQIGAQVTASIADPERYTFFGARSEKAPLWQHHVPDTFKELAKQATGRPDISEDEIKRHYFRERYRQLYGGSVKKPKNE